MAETAPPPPNHEPNDAAGGPRDWAPRDHEPPGETRGPRPERGEPLWRDALGESLRALRHDRGEKLTDTAGRAGISPQYLSEIERGIKDPSSEMIAAVAGALDLSLTDLTVAVAERLRSFEFTASVGSGHRSFYALAA
jgi:DNA-binding XRE family transcriptional regulator